MTLRAAFLTPKTPRTSRGAGGCDFGDVDEATAPQHVLWTAQALPSTVRIHNTPPEVVDPLHALSAAQLTLLDARETHGSIIDVDGQPLHIESGAQPVSHPAALLPLDCLFEVRAQSALRLWRALAGRSMGPNPARLTVARRSRLLLALRALDGYSANASYREIAAALFSRRAIPDRGWKTHDLRDRTIRLVRTGRELMQGGYRSLLLYPYRRGSHRHHDP